MEMTESRSGEPAYACFSRNVMKALFRSSQRIAQQGFAHWHQECSIGPSFSRSTTRACRDVSRGRSQRDTLSDDGVDLEGFMIDSYRFLDFATRQVMKAWAARQQSGVIPFRRLAKRLSECTVALVSTA